MEVNQKKISSLGYLKKLFHVLLTTYSLRNMSAWVPTDGIYGVNYFLESSEY